MRIRSARTLVFSRQGEEMIGCNYLTSSTFVCSPDLLTFLTRFDEWATLDDVADFVAMPADEVTEAVNGLIAVQAVTVEGSQLAQAEDSHVKCWKWGIPAALFHFSVLDRRYMSLDQMEEFQRARIAEGEAPCLYLRNDGCAGPALTLPSGLGSDALLQLMARRRTVRSAAPVPISLTELSDCLFAGLGITGETRNCVGSLPLGMTPSGGARNPYEAYVYVRSVSGLEPGFYHYAAIDHTLGRIDTGMMPQPSELLGGQEWADEMPCTIILCALFERTMWKYADANAYRVVLIEAGHIGQNVMLAATRHGLSACPSAALSHSEINRCIGLPDNGTQSPIYALTLARPALASEGQTVKAA